MLLIGQIVLGVYGVLLILGGTMGMVKAGSKVSLIAGGIFGVASLVALRISLDDPAQGMLIGGLLAFLLTGVFVSRFVRTRKWMPAGVIMLLSLAVAILLIAVQRNLGLPG